jgi:uncharacterized membrane protein YtjA (UPF0391 family)
MLYYSIAFLLIALPACALGFGGIAGTAAVIAEILFILFVVLFVAMFLRGKSP